MTTLQTKAQELFSNPLADDSTVAHNISQWIKAMEYLGDKHILAKTVQRKDNTK